jgi:predicted NUDIX family phosphoesterase
VSQVFVVDRAEFFAGDWPQGFTALRGADAERLLERAFHCGRFVDRATAERTPAWKQWIPYGALVCGPGPGPGPIDGVFTVQRTRGQSEARLHGLFSVGLGGHIEPVDVAAAAGPQFFANALRRELLEELDFGGLALPPPELIGLINDDSTEVGAVHAGLCYRLALPLPLATARQRVRIAETDKMRGGLTPLAELADLWQTPSQFETWSQLLIRAGVLGMWSTAGTA